LIVWKTWIGCRKAYIKSWLISRSIHKGSHGLYPHYVL